LTAVITTDEFVPADREIKFNIDTSTTTIAAVILKVHSGTCEASSPVAAWYIMRLTYSANMSDMTAAPPGLMVDTTVQV
jgi:hypothetical protein